MTYHDREWLTPMGNPSTPSVSSFAGIDVWREDKDPYDYRMIEISSCNDKTNLHKTDDQTNEDWKEQVETLYNHIGRYLQYLKKETEAVND